MKRYSTLLLASTLFVAACSKKTPIAPGPPPPAQSTPTVKTFAGSGTQGFADGTKTLASFNYPTGIAIASSGFLFIADKQNNRIRIISPQGVVNTIAGTGKQGFSNTAGATAFNFPNGVGIDFAGNVYVADMGNAAIRAINTNGVVTTFPVNTTGAPVIVYTPAGIVSDASGNVYVSDNSTSLIKKITSKGVITTVAGSGSRGNANGIGTAASFNQPSALAIDSTGNLYVADQGNNLIRKITPDGSVSTLAGSGNAGATNGVGTAASFNAPAGVTVDAKGNVYVGDSNNNLIRKIARDGTVTTLAGTGKPGTNDGALATATFNNPQGVAVDQYNRVFVADTGNGLIRMIQQ
ncbi:NHL repeat-containing protein [Mucilaginibacter sp. McL0603]|uniref:NHL repeat-containing protein n=1 Tax=Mucilaginibacter sp. McL0603 TaxID=3415670 RepID=UPI003CE97244